MYLYKIIKFTGVSPSVLNTLKRYGYIDFQRNRNERGDPFSCRTSMRKQNLRHQLPGAKQPSCKF